MKRRYIVVKPLKVNKKSYFVGQVVPHNQLKYLSQEDLDTNIYIQDYNDIVSPYNYGMIFHSKEFPHPKGTREETLEEIEERFYCEMNKECEIKEVDESSKIFDIFFDITFE